MKAFLFLLFSSESGHCVQTFQRVKFLSDLFRYSLLETRKSRDLIGVTISWKWQRKHFALLRFFMSKRNVGSEPTRWIEDLFKLSGRNWPAMTQNH